MGHDALRGGNMSAHVNLPEMNRSAGESGFSLIELMIAMAVLTFGLVSIVGLSAYVSHANIDSNITGVLATTAQAQVDQLKSAVWTVSSCDTALQVGGSLTSNVSGYNTTVTGTQIGDLNVRWQVADGGTPDYRTVSINVAQTTPFRDFPNGLTITTIIMRQ
jgi:prepilin-type N-terminal cleavage/methylation domain-containing protein